HFRLYDIALTQEEIQALNDIIDGIQTIRNHSTVSSYYNLTGQRISQPHKGFYIKDNKKYYQK
ncbi:MAG: hypothetical protein II521_06415, partial [Prevotella sp.]|nr:hypothetical protein [Prevotella sp.]